MPVKRASWVYRHKIPLAFVALALAAIVQGVYLKGTINDVQHDRIISCQRTYEGVRQVFRPFFPPPHHRTQKQKHDLRTFNNTIDSLKRHCHLQTGVKK